MKVATLVLFLDPARGDVTLTKSMFRVTMLSKHLTTRQAEKELPLHMMRGHEVLPKLPVFIIKQN
jgi:hypothetical protein